MMYRSRLAIFLGVLLCVVVIPTRSFAQGGTLAPNDSDSGSLSEVSPNDWWQITIIQDGALVVTTTTGEELEIDLGMYTQDQTTLLASGGVWGTVETVTHTNLGPGNYLIKVHRWSGAGTYSITSQFTPTSYDTDPETNDSSVQAVLLETNGSDTGHLYHYYDGVYDTDDWWKVTVPLDGHLIVTTQSDSTLEIDMSMYDVDGETYIKGYDISWGTRERTQYENLMPGTYYIKAYRWSGYGAYTITSEFIPASLENDTEDNDSTAVAQILPIDASDTGHLGFHSIDEADIDDFWAVTVPADGSLKVITVSDSTLEIDLYMYDDNGETNIAGYDVGYGIIESTTRNDLTPGTYYIKVYKWSGYGSYTITSDFTPTALLNDHEPNGEVETAVVVTNQITHTGHLGHFDSGSTDTDDYFMVNVPVEWDTLYVHSISDSTLEIDIVVYGAGGTSTVASGSGYGIEEWATRANLAEATYFIRMHRWSGWGSYSFIVSNSTAARPGEIPNAVSETVSAPESYQLSAPYPNPFNPFTTIPYTIPVDGRVRIVVYDILGRELVLLVDEIMHAGEHTALWDARDRYGNSVGNGVYLFRMEAGGHIATQRAVLIK